MELRDAGRLYAQRASRRPLTFCELELARLARSVLTEQEEAALLCRTLRKQADVWGCTPENVRSVRRRAQAKLRRFGRRLEHPPSLPLPPLFVVVPMPNVREAVRRALEALELPPRVEPPPPPPPSFDWSEEELEGLDRAIATQEELEAGERWDW